MKSWFVDKSCFSFSNFLHSRQFLLYLGLSDSFKTFLSSGLHDVVLSTVSWPPLWVDHAPGHSGLVLQPSKAALVTWICPEQRTLMGRRGSCALAEVRLGDWAEPMKTVGHSGSGQRKRRPGSFRGRVGVSSQCRWLGELVFLHHRIQQVESILLQGGRGRGWQEWASFPAGYLWLLPILV